MDDSNIFVRKVDTRIVLLECCVVPLLNGSEKYTGQSIAGELDVRGYSADVVQRHDASQHGWEMQGLIFRDLRDLIIRHGHVRGAEVDCALRELLDSSAGADRLVVNLYLRVRFSIGFKPLLVNWRWECCTSGVDRFAWQSR